MAHRIANRPRLPKLAVPRAECERSRFRRDEHDIDDVRIATERHGIYVKLRDRTMAYFQVTNFRNTPFDVCFHFARSAGIALIYVVEDTLAISEGALGVADPHIPWRLFDRVTTSSGTNSPRSACATPSRIAASVASSSGSSEASPPAIERIIAASVSCSSSESPAPWLSLVQAAWS